MSDLALTFNETQFDIIDRNGQPWIRSPQIEVALGFTKRGAVQILYSHHADEFTDSMTALVKLPTDGGEQEVRIFSPRGCHLLAMFARTPVAKEFRKWVLDVLDRLPELTAKAQAPQQTPGAINSLEDLYALRLAQYQHLQQPEKEQMRLRIYRRLTRNFGTSRLTSLTPEQWAKAAALITAPTQKTGNNGICAQSLKTRATQREFVQAIPDFDLAKLPEAFDELLKTADVARESLKKMEGLIDYATSCGHNPYIGPGKRAVINNAADLVQIARGNLQACEYALRSFARLSTRINFLTFEPLKLA